MKTPEKSANAQAHAGKQKKQLVALGGLFAVFIAVLAIQFGSGDSAPKASAMTAPEPASETDVAATDAGGDSDSGGGPADPGVVPFPVAKDNPVLAEPLADASIKRSPFSNFWSVTPTGGSNQAMPALSAPTITLNATMPSDTRGLAVIDGQLRFTGDSIQGWSLAEVSPRSVTLRAPTGESVVVDMPLLVGRLSLPADLDLGSFDGMAGVEPVEAAAPSDG